MESLSKIQASLGAQRDRAIDDLQCAVTEAEGAEQERQAGEDLLSNSQKAKETPKPAQTKMQE